MNLINGEDSIGDGAENHFISAEVRSFSDFMLNPLTQSFCTKYHIRLCAFATYLVLQALTSNLNSS
jgi:hypothetical protein